MPGPEYNRAAMTATRIGMARALGGQLDGGKQDAAVAVVARHSDVVRYWRRCVMAALVGIPVGLLLLVLGALAHGHGTWPTVAIGAGVGVFVFLALGQHFGIQHALIMTAGMFEAENETPHAP